MISFKTALLVIYHQFVSTHCHNMRYLMYHCEVEGLWHVGRLRCELVWRTRHQVLKMTSCRYIHWILMLMKSTVC